MGIIEEALEGNKPKMSIVDEALGGEITPVAQEIPEEPPIYASEMGDLSKVDNPARVMGSLVGGLAAFPVSGVAGLSKLITSGGDLDEARKTMEGIQSVPAKLLDTEQEAEAAAMIGEGLSKPFTMAGEGLKEIVKQTPLEGTIAEPIAGTIGEASAMFGLPGIRSAVKRLKGKPAAKPVEPIPEAVPEKPPVTAQEAIPEPNVQPPPKPEIVEPGAASEAARGETAQEYKNTSTPLDGLISEQRTAEQRGSFSLEKKGESKPPTITFEGEIEQRFQAAKGLDHPGIIQRAKEIGEDIALKMSRTYEHLPRTGEFAEAGFALKKLEKQRDVTAQKTIIKKAEELAGLDKTEYDIFTRKVILDDLTHEAAKGNDLPFGFTLESLMREKAKIDNAVKSSPNIQEAIAKRRQGWDELKAKYAKAMNDIGFDVTDRFSREDYFRHQVLEYANLKGLSGSGRQLKSPTNRGFLKKRQGSERDINTDYLEAEYEVFGQMKMDVEIARTIKRIDDNYNIADQVKKQARAKGLDDWRRAVPEGYTTWQPREGNIFYFTDSIPAKLAAQLYSGALEELGITAADLNKAMSVGGKRREFVIKQELADTLNELVKARSQGLFPEASRTLMKGWKVWQLISPRRVIKYNARNLTGDADAAFTGNPSGFNRVPQAISELFDVYVKKKQMSPEMQEYFDRGGLQATLQAQEIGDLKNLWVFKKLYPEGTKASPPRKAWERYWKAARMSTDFREGILRYANYLDFLDQMKRSPNGRPKSFGASIPEEIMGLRDIRDRAFWLSNDLLGAYDRVSVFGQSMREHVFPFWSWKEVNFKRYKQFVKNAIDEGTLPQTVARKILGGAAIKSPYIAYRVGVFLTRATALASMLQVWNHTMFPEEEKNLSYDVRKSVHIILGKDPETGAVIYFNRMGALGDLLEWFGLDAAPKYIDRWMRNRESLKDIALDMAKDAGKAPINVLVSGSVPGIKIGLESATGRSTFPNVFKPSTIRDRGLYLARSFGLENEYKALAGLPSKGYAQSIANLAVYSVDPLEGAYRDIFELKNEFLKKQGKSAEGFWLTPKGDALYNMKLALRYRDKEAFTKYATDYFMLGGKPEGIKASIERMNPLSGMNKNEQQVFFASLDKRDQEKLGKAMQFFQTTLIGNKK